MRFGTQVAHANYVLHRHFELYDLETFLWEGWQFNLADNVSGLFWFQDYLE